MSVWQCAALIVAAGNLALAELLLYTTLGSTNVAFTDA